MRAAKVRLRCASAGRFLRLRYEKGVERENVACYNQSIKLEFVRIDERAAYPN